MTQPNDLPPVLVSEDQTRHEIDRAGKAAVETAIARDAIHEYALDLYRDVTRLQGENARLRTLVLEATAAAEAMRLMDFDKDAQRLRCRVCRYPYARDQKTHFDDCLYVPFVRAMAKLHAHATGLPNWQSEAPTQSAEAALSALREENDKACEALEFAQGAILDAIGLEDGLDGKAGAAVLSIIRAALTANGRTLQPLPDADTEADHQPVDVALARFASAALRSAVKQIEPYLQHKRDCQLGKPVLHCPTCHGPIWRVTGNGTLNEYQFDAVKAGDYFCKACVGDQAEGTTYRYWWTRELQVYACSCGLSTLAVIVTQEEEEKS